MGPGKVCDYLKGGYHNPPKRNRIKLPLNLIFLFFLKLKLKMMEVDRNLITTLENLSKKYVMYSNLNFQSTKS